MTLVFQLLPDSPEAVAAAFDLVLRRKGLVAEAMSVQREAVLAGRYPYLKPWLDELREVRSEAAGLALALARAPSPRSISARLIKLLREKQGLEVQLALQIPEIDLRELFETITRQSVASALPEVSVLVEFARFKLEDFNAFMSVSERAMRPHVYAAFVVHSGQPDAISVVRYPNGKAIDNCTIEFLREVSTPRSECGCVSWQ